MTELIDPVQLARENANELMILRESIAERRADFQAALHLAKSETQKVERERDKTLLQLSIVNNRCSELENELNNIYRSKSWRYTKSLRKVVGAWLRVKALLKQVRIHYARAGGGRRGLAEVVQKIYRRISTRGVTETFRYAHSLSQPTVPGSIKAKYLPKRKGVVATEITKLDRHGTVSIIVCVHNALADVQRCLASVLQFSTEPYELVVVDDGSGEETANFLNEFQAVNAIRFHRNEQARGYTFAANQGLALATGNICILLNSDTIVSPYWLELMERPFAVNPALGLAGPLSNTASWQSIPKIEEFGDWATNELPENWSVEKFALEVINSNRFPQYPDMPILNGFCLAIHRKVLDQLGGFDEENFGSGYGEENDYCLRARKAGFGLGLVDNLYVYHAQSKSYSHERRKVLGDQAGLKLERLHGQAIIDEAVEYCRHDAVLEGIRARAEQIIYRSETVATVKGKYEGRKILFLLPVIHGGGGANIVIAEALAMQSMGLQPSILNLSRCKPEFETAYPHLNLPVVYVEEPDELRNVAVGFDAVIATANHTVAWMKYIAQPGPALGYYIQDYEPFFYPEGSKEFLRARQSYRLIDRIAYFTKTDWNRQILLEKEGVESTVIGASYDDKLYYPFQKETVSQAVRIVAMVRPSSERRGPKATVDTLKQIHDRHGSKVSIEIFGAQACDLLTLSCDLNFKFNLWGTLDARGVRDLLVESDIFLDFSTYQAMGLTAMEAMACGLAVVAPKEGGANTFLRHEKNGLLIDTLSANERLDSVDRLIEDPTLRARLGNQALRDLPAFAPEYSAAKMLDCIFQHNYR